MSKVTPIVAILAIGALSAFALSRNIDGLALAGAFALIAGIAGYSAPHKKPKE